MKPGDDNQLQQAIVRRERDILAINTTNLSARPGWSERLLPYLLVIMEVCWIDAILLGVASLNIFQTHELIAPLWSPFVLMASGYWLTNTLERRALKRAPAGDGVIEVRVGSLPFISIFTVLILLTLWSSMYASSYLPIDPRWIGNLLADLLLLMPNAYHITGLIALAIYFCWRGMRLTRQSMEPDRILWTLRLGAGVLIAVVFVHSSASLSDFNELFLFFLILCFFLCALFAHALAKAIFMRKTHPSGLQGSMIAQERALLTVMILIGALLLLSAFVIHSFAQPSFLLEMQRALSPLGDWYDQFVSLIAHGLVLLFTPIFWLISLLHFETPAITPLRRNSLADRFSTRPQGPDPVLAALPILKLLVPILFCIGMIILIRWLLRKRRVTVVRSEEDLHESIWSWQFFWQQIKQFWLHLFARRKREQAAPRLVDGEDGPLGQTIREIYRSFLAWSSRRGQARRKGETPGEFQQRLERLLPDAEPELRHLTEAYIRTRYGRYMADTSEVVRLRRELADLQNKVDAG